MGDDDCALARVEDRAMIQPGSNVATNAQLSSLEHCDPYSAGLQLLGLDLLMQGKLRAIEAERDQLA
jgi:hypothetical protein